MGRRRARHLRRREVADGLGRHGRRPHLCEGAHGGPRSCGSELIARERSRVGEEGGDRVAHLARARPALLRLHPQGPVDHGGDGLTHPGRAAPHRRGRHRAEGHEQRADRVGGGERRVAGDRVKERDAERPHVRRHAEVFAAAGLLGRHVERGAHDRARARELGAPRVLEALPEDLRDAEVEELHPELSLIPLAEEEVGRLDVSVEDPLRVRLLKAEAGLAADAQDRLRREHAVLFEGRVEVSALEELHHEVRDAERVVVVDVEHLRDVLRLDGAGRAGLQFEARGDLGLRRQVLRDDLERDAATRGRVPRLVDRAHPSLPEEAGDRVAPAHDRSCLHGGTIAARA